MNEEKRLPYFILGLGVGVAFGMLFAPQTGEETRVLLRRKADEGTDFIKRHGEKLRGSASEYVEKGRSVITEHVGNLTAAVDAGQSAYREATSGESGMGGRASSPEAL